MIKNTRLLDTLEYIRRRIEQRKEAQRHVMRIFSYLQRVVAVEQSKYLNIVVYDNDDIVVGELHYRETYSAFMFSFRITP